MSWWDPSSVSNEQLDKEVSQTNLDAFNRTGNGGIQRYYNMSNGDTLIKDTEPADNAKWHNTTEFVISGGCISSINPHSTNE